MKKFTLLAICLMVVPMFLWSQEARKVFVQEFTQASCPPCTFHNPPFDKLMEANKDKVVLIKFNTWWPGYDPMFDHNPVENEQWIRYNTVGGAPNVILSGQVLPTGQYFEGAPLNVTQAMIEQLYQQTSPLKIELDHELNNSLDSIRVRVRVINLTDQAVNYNDMRLRMNLIEREINFETAPGTNTEKHFLHIARKFIPDMSGVSLGNSIAPNDTLSYSFDAFVPEYLYRYNDVAVVAWVQVQGTRAVLQSEISWPKPIDWEVGDVATFPEVDAGAGLCEHEVNGSVLVLNEGEGEVNELRLAYLVNGSISEELNWSGSLAPGGDVLIDLPEVLISEGRSDVSVSVLAVNNARDTSAFNNQYATTFFKLPKGVYADQLNEGFEGLGLGENPASIVNVNPNEYRTYIVDRTVNSQLITWPLGAYENSESCYRFDFPTIDKGGESELVFKKIDMSNYENAYLAFSYAYTNMLAENDRLRVMISDDCGVSWTELFNKAGGTLRTAPQVSGERFYPRAADWVTDTLDISAFDGAGEVIISFLGRSDLGNCLYLDDIVLGEKMGVNTSNPGILAGQLTVSPNPVRDILNIDVELSEAATGEIRLYDLVGKAVELVQAQQSLPAGMHRFSWSPNVGPGVYLLKIQTDKGELTEKITVVK